MSAILYIAKTFGMWRISLPSKDMDLDVHESDVNVILFFINISLLTSKTEHLFLCVVAYKFIFL